MAVVSGAWWNAWWEWMAVWLIAAAGAAALVAGVSVLVYRRLTRPVKEHSSLGHCVYLHDQAIMNLYEMGNYTAALEKAVEERRNVSTTAGIRGLGPFGWRADRDNTQEMFTTYVQTSKPISVIGMLLSVFERKDAIVYVDLKSGSIRPNHSLARKHPPGENLALSEVTQFVSVEGRFTASRPTPERVLMRARYSAPDGAAHLAVDFDSDGLQIAQLYKGEFQARCIGKIIGWDAETREVTLDAIAILR